MYLMSNNVYQYNYHDVKVSYVFESTTGEDRRLQDIGITRKRNCMKRCLAFCFLFRSFERSSITVARSSRVHARAGSILANDSMHTDQGRWSRPRVDPSWGQHGLR